MRIIIKKAAKVIFTILGILLLILLVMAIYHHIRIAIDKPEIEAVGTPVSVDGYNMNVYTESEKKSQEEPTVVLLSGSGIASPIYDYKVLYSKLSGYYRVAVVEKFGYGYSDISGITRDVATMVREDREALIKAGESAPYVLMPHSMSALEAVYWAYTYPDEIQAIVGLDMAVPESYNKNISGITAMKIGAFCGLHRFEIFNPISSLGLAEKEYVQNKLLNYQNALNTDVYNECKKVLKNADTVRNMDISEVPVLMFTTNLGGSTGSENWVAAQENFAGRMKHCTQIKYECGHSLYYYKSEEMAEDIIEFLDGLDS